jgi:hypothetical protein
MNRAILQTLEHLLTHGEVKIEDLASLPAGDEIGLWTHSEDGNRAVVTHSIIHLLRTLPTTAEAIGAILSCQPEIRQSWQQIVIARLQELGKQRDTTNLCEAISTLDRSAPALLTQLPTASLAPTPYTELERSLFEVPAAQAIAAPKLYRILGATAHLIEGRSGNTKETLPNIDPVNPIKNWLKNRSIQPPHPETNATTVSQRLKSPLVMQSPPSRTNMMQEISLAELDWRTTSILSGSWDDYSPPAAAPPELAAMYWVLARPWCFLLAQIVFTQEAWAAERISGELILELDPSNVFLSDRPPKLCVVVTSTDGAEILCGSLGELLLRVLDRLGIAILAPEIDTLDAQLAPVIAALLHQQVWQFSLGAGGYRPHYSIHPTFSDTCYRAIGSKYFNRLASSVTATIRSTSEQWAKERRMVMKSLETKVSARDAKSAYAD